jgi:uncharacterized protein YndB with AHSA1/START domain
MILFDFFTIKRVICATPKRLFEAWLDSRGHSDMTGRAATAGTKVGEAFTGYDGLITGKNIEIDAYHRIVQDWHSVIPGFEPIESRVEIALSTLSDSGAIANAHDDGTTMIVHHSMLPEGQLLFNSEWWEDVYFKPMDAYFAQGGNRFESPTHQIGPG